MAMNFAKINTETNTITEFPILDHQQEIELLRCIKQYKILEDIKANLPEGYVFVEEPEKPALEWNQAYRITGAELSDGVWTMSIEIYDQYPTDEEKISAARTLQKVKRSTVNGSYNVQMGDLFNSEYSEYERSTFPQQRAEATAYLADNTASVPLLNAIATARGITVETLANKIIEKAEAHDIALGTILGKRKKDLDLLDAIDLNDVNTFSNFNDTSV
jgi:hypothetical protein